MILDQPNPQTQEDLCLEEAESQINSGENSTHTAANCRFMKYTPKTEFPRRGEKPVFPVPHLLEKSCYLQN